MVALDKERVKKIKEMNKAGEFPDELMDKAAMLEWEENGEKEIEYADVTGEIELPNIKRKRRRKNRKNRAGRGQSKKISSNDSQQEKPGNNSQTKSVKNKQSQPGKTEENSNKKPGNKRRNKRRRPNRKTGNQNPSNTKNNSKE